MDLNRILQFFVTKEDRFFPLFIEQAKAVKRSAENLLNMVSTTDKEARTVCNKEIKNQEVHGDNILREFEAMLYSLYITPFDRQDLHEFAELMDDLLDRLDDASNIIFTHHYLNIDPDLVRLAENLVMAADQLTEITEKFTNIDDNIGSMVQNCNKIRDIEHDSDDIYGNYISKLFEQPDLGLVETIKRKDIVQSLENSTNTAKYISDKIFSIISKLS